MNILTITANDNSIGGASRVSMDIHEQLKKNGHFSTVYAGKKESGKNDVTEISRPIWRKLVSKLFANDIDFYSTDYLIESEHFVNADIVHCHNLSGGYFNLETLVKMSIVKPVVWTLHDMWAINPHSGYTDSRDIVNGLYSVSDPSLYPKTLWNNDSYLSKRKTELFRKMKLHLVSPCNWLDELLQNTSLASQDRHVIENGVDTSLFVPHDKDQLKRDLGLPPIPVVIFIGASALNNQFKGFSDFIWMADKANGEAIKFICVGAAENYIDGNIQFVRQTSDKSVVANYLASADVFVLPSRFETFPLVILEAISCGTPVIAYDVGGVKEALDFAPGCKVIEKYKKDEMYEAVIKICNLPPHQKKKNAIGLRKLATKFFSLESMVTRYYDLYEQIIFRRV